MISFEELQRNIDEVEKGINSALIRSGRKREEITLIAVSKMHPPELIEMAYNAGLKSFGENKVQEALLKQQQLHQITDWHLIGHLQTNKVKQVIGKFKLVHSVDSEKLAAEINKRCEAVNTFQDVLLQVNISNESSKFGLPPEGVLPLAEIISELYPRVKVKGLMTIGLFTDDNSEIRKEFSALKKLFDELSSKGLKGVEMEFLSMGMSNDYKIAIEEGSNMVRVGTAIFGQRNYV